MTHRFLFFQLAPNAVEIFLLRKQAGNYLTQGKVREVIKNENFSFPHRN